MGVYYEVAKRSIEGERFVVANPQHAVGVEFYRKAFFVSQFLCALWCPYRACCRELYKH